MTRNVNYELVALSVIIAVIGVVRDVVDDDRIFLAIWFFVRLCRAGGAEFQNFVLEGPAAPAVGGMGCGERVPRSLVHQICTVELELTQFTVTDTVAECWIAPDWAVTVTV